MHSDELDTEMGETGARCDEHGDVVGAEVGGGRMDDAGATASEHQSVTPTHQHCASPPTLTVSSLSSSNLSSANISI